MIQESFLVIIHRRLKVGSFLFHWMVSVHWRHLLIMYPVATTCSANSTIQLLLSRRLQQLILSSCAWALVRMQVSVVRAPSLNDSQYALV
jgi:hypothetical protein